MRPEAKPKAEGKPSKEHFLALGIPEELAELLRELGYDSVNKIRAEKKPGRLNQMMMGYRKKTSNL